MILLEMKDAADKALEAFLNDIGAIQQRRARRSQMQQPIHERKSRALVPIRKLLKNLQDLNVLVHHREHYARTGLTSHHPPQRLAVYENESSPLWRPGPALYLEHPAMIEIAIPNTKQQTKEGVIVIRCASEHPDSDLLTGPFGTIGEAAVALGRFLARSTVSCTKRNTTEAGAQTVSDDGF